MNAFSRPERSVHNLVYLRKIMYNIPRIKKALINRDIVEQRETGLYISDPIFNKWFRRFYGIALTFLLKKYCVCADKNVYYGV